MTPSIAVIGAGMAGITAARTLTDAGLSVHLFDKSRGSGGRLSSRRSPAGALDLGAAAFGARSEAFGEALHQWQQQGWVDRWRPAHYRCRAGRLSPEPSPSLWLGTPRMSALTRGLLGKIPATFGCRICELLPIREGWQLRDSEGGEHGPFARVIVALPAPQAALLLTAVPELAACAAAHPMEPAWVVALTFAHPLATPVQSCAIEGGPLAWAGRDAGKPGRSPAADTWVLHASPAWSRKNRELAPQKVIHRLHQALMETLGCELPALEDAQVHRWLYALPANPGAGRVLADGNGLIACGDWCEDGTVEGAWHSGRQAAERTLESFGAKP